MPDSAEKLHRRRHKRVVFRKLELGRENAAFERGAIRSFDQRFPDEHVVFVDGARGDAIGWVVGEVFVLLEETFAGY